MNSQQLRQAFLHYFSKKGHEIVPSSPVIPHDDPTLLFINAGMNQFKDVFLGKSKRDYSTATTTQKCIRVGGKHNDLENVGHTSRHLTFFEMLGNFSFGKYFKKEAIEFAWEVTQTIFQLDTNRVWATVFYEDEQSFELWKKYLPEERIVRMGEKDNFWSMGDVGPCGPCSELLYDRGENYGSARSPAEDFDGERYLEFWNLVFMQFNRKSDGTSEPLPVPCVDTGCGLERIVSLQTGKDSLFDTDILRTLIHHIEMLSKQTYDGHPKAAAFRVIADHVRCLSFAIADGVQPSNLDRGYVLRKVLRRAVRYGRQLNFDKPFLAKLIPPLVELMGADFPELISSQARIEEILTQEEENFIRTLKRGGNLLGQIMQTAAHEGRISGEDAFKLKDTYGLPLEEILLIAKDEALGVDIERFEELEHEAKMRSKKAHKGAAEEMSSSLYENFAQKHAPCVFTGYQNTTQECVVTGLIHKGAFVSRLEEGEEGEVFVDSTPFYAECGGQIGDQGHLFFKEEAIFHVLDTQSPFPGVIAHRGVVKKGALHINQILEGVIDTHRRRDAARHHTATHLLHWALQEVLGPHIRQAGSIVEPKRLRFDFSHHKSLTLDEIERVEDLINEKIQQNLPVSTYEISLSEANQQADIKQFFGEKYGSKVRVVDTLFARELCGGTHVNALGELGSFSIEKEISVAAGIRRIEAVVGKAACISARENVHLLRVLSAHLKTTPPKLEEMLTKLMEQNRQMSSQIGQLKKQGLMRYLEELKAKIETLDKNSFLCEKLPLDAKELQTVADLLMAKHEALALFLFGEDEGRCPLVVRVSKPLVSKGAHAGEWLKEIAPFVGGKGGGRPEMAQGAGQNPEKTLEALEEAKKWIRTKISS